MNILRIDGSARFSGSATRQLANEVIARLRSAHPGADIVQRELSDGLPLLDESWINASFSDPTTRSDAQRDTLTLSDTLIAELKAADIIVMATPIYNFGIPAAVKAWVDLVCRPGETFRYSESGPVGLLADRPVYLVIASGGVPIGSAMDFATDYLRHVFAFIGIHDLRLIEAGETAADEQAALQRARAQMDAIGVERGGWAA